MTLEEAAAQAAAVVQDGGSKTLQGEGCTAVVCPY